jgi:hypothetical protein
VTEPWEEEIIANTPETAFLSNAVVRIGFYSLGAALFVFVAMLLLAGVHPW